MARHELRSRRPTTTCQKEPNEYREKIVDFIIFVEQQRRKFNYQHIYAADETAVYIDFSNSLTVEKRSAKEVRALHFSHCSRSGVNWFGKIGFGFKNFKVLKTSGFQGFGFGFNLCFRCLSKQLATRSCISRSYSQLDPMATSVNHLFCFREFVLISRSDRNSKESLNYAGLDERSSMTNWLRIICKKFWVDLSSENVYSYGTPTDVISVKERRRSWSNFK